MDSIRSLYNEYVFGLNGHKSIKSLLAIKKVRKRFRVWADRPEELRWSKSKRIISFVEILGGRPGWDVDKAITCLDELRLSYFKGSISKMKEAFVLGKDPPAGPLKELFVLMGHPNG